MAFTVTARHIGNNAGTATQTQATNSTTPTANSLFLVGHAASINNSSSAVLPSFQTPTGGSLTYTVIAKDGESVARSWGAIGGFDAGGGMWRAPIGGTPSAFAVTCDPHSGTETAYQAVVCCDITGHDASNPIVQSKANGAGVNPDSSSASGTVTLDAVPANGNLIVVLVSSGADTGGAFGAVTAGAGKTLTASATQEQAKHNGGLFYRVCDGTESATITCADLGDTVGNYSMVAVEISAAPPLFVADYEGTAGWASTATPKTTGTFDGSFNDVLVTLLADPNDNGTENYTFSSSPAETWTEQAETTGTTNGDIFLQTATTTLTANRNGMTASAARTAGDASESYNITVAHFTGSDGIGNTARMTGNGVANPSFAFTTNFNNSAIVYIIADWAATDGTVRTHRTVNGFTPTAGNGQELTYFTNGTAYTVYVAYIVNAGPAGSKTIGISAPAGGDCLIAAVEVKGSAGPPPTPPEGPKNSSAMNLMGKAYY